MDEHLGSNWTKLIRLATTSFDYIHCSAKQLTICCSEECKQVDMPLTLFRLVGTTYKVVNKFDTRMKPRVCVARLVEFRGALEREWAGTQTQVRHEDENPNPNPNGRLKKNTVGSFFYLEILPNSFPFA